MTTLSKPSPSDGRTQSVRKKIQNATSPTCPPKIPSFNPDAFFRARLAAAKTTAEKLSICARARRIPADEKTLRDFCFDKCPFDADKLTLLSIYRLLVVGMGVSSRELRDWAAEGAPAVGRNVAIELKNRRALVPDEYCEFFLANQRVVWGLEDVVDLEAGADVTMAEAVGETAAGAGAGAKASRGGKGDVVVISDSSGEESGAEDNGVETEKPREKTIETSDRGSASTPKVGASRTNPETASSTSSAPTTKESRTSFRKADPIPYKPRNKRFFKKRASGFARGLPEKYMMTRDGSATLKRGRDSSSPESTPEPLSKKRKFTKSSSK